MTIEKGFPSDQPTDQIPFYLIRDMIGGEIYAYKGWQEVVNQTKTLEQIMGCSGLQSFILEYLQAILFTQIGRKKYRFFTNETGNHLAKNENPSFDLAIYERALLTPDKITTKYVDVPPKVVVEVDVKVDTRLLSEMDFVHHKTQTLLNYKVEKVIWIFTKSKKVLIATPDEDWITMDWNRNIEFIDGVHFNIGKEIKNEGLII